MGRVLISGAAGFVGGNMVEQFRREGWEPVCWDISRGTESGADIQYVDMTRRESLAGLLEEASPDLIVHCAGSADVGRSVARPEEDFRSNVTATHNLLFAMLAAGLRKTRLIFLSSAAVYGTPVRLPVSEDAPLRPISPYALHKELGERMCMYFCCNYGFDIKILRIFSAYGSGLRKQLFWDMYRRVSAEGKLKLFGTGGESRDFIHISDLKRAVYLIAVKAPEEEVVYNVANGQEITVREAALLFARAMGLRERDVEFSGEVREGDPLNWKADIAKLTRLGYAGRMSMEQGIADYIKWAEREGGVGHR